ncbi:hypothetical protein PCE1_004146 [Barthelona sp. PCE]
MSFSYCDHPADIQITTPEATCIEESICGLLLGMYNVMTPIEHVDPTQKFEIEAEGDDLYDLIYNIMDEALFTFDCDLLVGSRARVLDIQCPKEGRFSIKVELEGEVFDLDKHEQGTEVKAITKSALRVVESEESCIAWVIIDI